MKKHFTFLKVLFLFLAWTLSGHAFAQDVKISGNVTDAKDGSSLPGVSIVIKGTTSGTVTDIDGKFSLSVKVGATVEFSFIGYNKQEVVIGAQRTLAVAMQMASTGLSEVLVIGYGTQKKIDKTGAVANITAGELNRGVLTDPVQALQGKTAGVSITKKGGDPNSGFAVKIRGQAGFFSGTDPIYIIDGVTGADPTTISPEDIESYTILKDASSTAIYGARGANGVILIETKKGKLKTANKVELNISSSIDNVAKKLDLLSADELKAFAARTGQASFLDGGANTDWQDAVFRTGHSQSYNLSSSGGDANSSYRASVTHSDFSGVIINSEKQRTTGRLNLNQKAIDNRLNLDATLSATFETNDYVKYNGNGPQDVIYQAIQRNPTDPVYTPGGGYYQINRDFQYNNPVALAELTQNQRLAKRILGNMKAEYEVLKDFFAGVNLSYIRNDDESFYFEPTNLLSSAFDGYGNRAYNNYESRLLETTLKYSTVINSAHNFNFVGGYSFQQDYKDGLKAQGRGAFSNFVMSNDLGSLINVNPRDISSYKESNRLISFFGRGIYNYNSKYYLTVTVRRDGSSKFGDNHEWGWFPSASLAWNITNESFLKNNKTINLLKLRASYGVSGNQEFDSYHDVIYAKSDGTGPNPETGTTAIIYKIPQNANPELKWEETSELNIGLDFGFLDSRISGSLEAYSKMTNDLLAPYNVPQPPNLYSTTWANAGSVSNKGVELNVQYFVIDNKNLDWKTTVAFSKNIQKLESLDSKDGKFSWTEADKKKGWLQGRGLVGDQNWALYLNPGDQLGTFFMPEYAGLSSDGKWLFYTANGGVTRNVADAERRVVGHALPNFELGWSNFIKLYGFDINLSIRAVVGGKVLNVTRMVFANPTALGNENGLTEAISEYDRGLRDIPKLNSYYLEDASYVKVDNLSIGYTFDTNKLKWMKSFRLSVTSNNLYTFTKYKGFDPEISYSGLDFGLDQFNTYPKTRTITFGLSASF